MVELEGDFINLRGLVLEDLTFLYTIENDVSLWELSQIQTPFSKDVLQKYLETAQNDFEKLKLYASKAYKANPSNPHVLSIYGDGFDGYKLNGPYDAIIMTASPSIIPDKLISQLKPNGRMVLPLNVNGSQKLYRVKNTKKGILKKEVDDVLFVPMLEGII